MRFPNSRTSEFVPFVAATEPAALSSMYAMLASVRAGGGAGAAATPVSTAAAPAMPVSAALLSLFLHAAMATAAPRTIASPARFDPINISTPRKVCTATVPQPERERQDLD